MYDSKQKGLFDFTGIPSDGKVVRNVVKNEVKESGRTPEKQKAQSSLFDSQIRAFRSRPGDAHADEVYCFSGGCLCLRC